MPVTCLIWSCWQKDWKFFPSISWAIISFIILGFPRTEKHCKIWEITFLKASPNWREANIKPLKVATVTCIYLSLPNSIKWVTSICQISLGTKARGLTPRCWTGRETAQSVQFLTISQACSWVNLNNKRREWAFKWWRECAWAAWERDPARTGKNDCVAASVKAFPSNRGPGNFKWARRWPIKRGHCLAIIKERSWRKSGAALVEGLIKGTVSNKGTEWVT